MVTRTIGSSDAAILLGLRPFADSDPHHVWSRCIGATGYDTSDDAVKQIGRVLEAGLLGLYADQNPYLHVKPGLGIEDEPVQGPESWMHARPDGYALDTRDVRARSWCLEVKTAGYLSAQDGWGEAGTDDVPMHYLVQCIWHMAVTGYHRCDLLALGLTYRDFRVYHIWRDEKVEEAVVGHCRDWYDQHVVTRTPPPVSNPRHAMRALASAYPAVVDRARAADDEALAKVAELAKAKDAAKRWTAHADRIQAELCNVMRDADTLVDGDQVLATWKARKGRSKVDLDAMRRDHPDLVDRYTIPGKPGRTFRLKERK